MANILAVDDNLELCKLIRTTLERDGHRVETRQAGRDLTEALCRWADCILLDVMMPGEDGFAVCRRIRSLTEVPILFLSARTDEAAVLEGLGIGADDFLSKPFRVAELRARVAAHLRRQSRTPAHRMVYPAAGLTRYFTGDTLAICNLAPTDQDANADLLISCDIAAAFAF